MLRRDAEEPTPSGVQLVSPQYLLAAGRVLLLGDSGSGKSTVLASVVPHGGLYVHARDLTHLAFQSEVQRGERVLLLDGFDELPVHRQADVAGVLAEGLQAGAVGRVVVAARALPAGRPLLSFLAIKRVPPLDRRAALEMLAGTAASAGPDVTLDRMLAVSEGNPLLLALLAEDHAQRRELPRRVADVLARAVERLVAATTGHSKSHDSVLAAFARVALDVLRSSTAETTEDRAVAALSPTLGEEAARRALTQPPAQPTTFLWQTEDGKLRFRHRLIGEYVASIALRDDHERLGALAELGHASDAIGFAIAGSQDPAACIVTVARRSGTDALARLTPHLDALPTQVLETARAAVLARVRAALGAGSTTLPARALPAQPWPAQQLEDEPDEPDAARAGWPVSLEEHWLELCRRKVGDPARGLELERFMMSFFGSFFRVVRHRYRGSTGEIDLVLAISSRDELWTPFGGEACVECKNRSSKAEEAWINQMAGARQYDRFKLAFFVSQAGFGRGAMNRIRKAAEHPGDMLIVPISGADITRALAHGEDPATFFTELVRDAKHGAVK